ncbi:hypothetical protein GCM10010412_069470 [Nonomuraea recticatena]|uniref:Uncharacterized protein n=1 Tax=Nonomuraea recticatena TaxID=46178 RepID=A0ABP6F470_9ACTN
MILNTPGDPFSVLRALDPEQPVMASEVHRAISGIHSYAMDVTDSYILTGRRLRGL